MGHCPQPCDRKSPVTVVRDARFAEHHAQRGILRKDIVWIIPKNIKINFGTNIAIYLSFIPAYG